GRVDMPRPPMKAAPSAPMHTPAESVHQRAAAPVEPRAGQIAPNQASGVTGDRSPQGSGRPAANPAEVGAPPEKLRQHQANHQPKPARRPGVRAGLPAADRLRSPTG